MKPDDIANARRAWKEAAYLEERLRYLEKPKFDQQAFGYSAPYEKYQLDKFQRDVNYLEERKREQQKIFEPVLQWAETAPDIIREIVLERVVYQRSWAEISAELLGSPEPNTSFMRLRRYMVKQAEDLQG